MLNRFRLWLVEVGVVGLNSNVMKILRGSLLEFYQCEPYDICVLNRLSDNQSKKKR